MLDHWTPGTEIVLTKNPNFWGDAPKLDRVVIQNIAEWGTRFSELQAGDADVVTVNAENRSQADALVGEISIYDPTTQSFGAPQEVCGYDSSKTGTEKFTVCEAGQKGTGGPLRVYMGQPNLLQDVVLYNFNIK